MPRRKKVEALKKEGEVVESTSIALSETEPAELKQAMRAMEIDPWEVMSYRIYPDKVVVIQGPVGWKRVWPIIPGQS